MFQTCLLPTLLLLGTRSEGARAAGRTHVRCSMGLKALPKFFFQGPLASTNIHTIQQLYTPDGRSSLVLQTPLMGFLFLIRSLCQNWLFSPPLRIPCSILIIKNDHLGGGRELHFPDNLANENNNEEGEKHRKNPDTNPSKCHRLSLKNSENGCEWTVQTTKF